MKNKKYPIPVLLAGLPKGVAEKACKYAQDKPITLMVGVDFKYASQALVWGFEWLETKEGNDYWYNIQKELKENLI